MIYESERNERPAGAKEGQECKGRPAAVRASENDRATPATSSCKEGKGWVQGDGDGEDALGCNSSPQHVSVV